MVFSSIVWERVPLNDSTVCTPLVDYHILVANRLVDSFNIFVHENFNLKQIYLFIFRFAKAPSEV